MEISARKKTLIILSFFFFILVCFSIILSLMNHREIRKIKESALTAVKRTAGKKPLKSRIHESKAEKKIKKNMGDEETALDESPVKEVRLPLQKKKERRKRNLDEIIRDLVNTLED